MINLRYHIVSLTAVFLAIGIGLTLGSTFLDRATVENLNGQLESLEGRLADRETRIGELEGRLDQSAATRDALDEQGDALLADRLVGVPVMVLTAEGADGEDVAAASSALVAAGADLRGTLVVTSRFRLDDESSIADLGSLIDDGSADPSRLRRVAIAALGGELRNRQLLASEPGADAPTPADPEESPGQDLPSEETPAEQPVETPSEEPATGDEAVDPVADEPAPVGQSLALVDGLVETGFLDFTAPAAGIDSPTFPPGTRLVIVGGSSDVPDDLILEPLIERMVRATTTPLLGVVTSALVGDGQVGDAVSVVRQTEGLRELVPTVDSVEHFEGRAALVLALVEVGEGVVGHYGLAEGASQLLPPLRT